jgi:ParB family chromosome partitioning protein
MTKAPTVEKPLASSPRREILKLGRKPAAPTVPAAPRVQIVPSAPRLIPLGQLRRAPENVRHTRSDEALEEMADDIAAHGLLQSLIGYDGNWPEDQDLSFIVGGGRRLGGMLINRTRGLLDDTFLVPVLIRSQEEAIELSLAENLQQRTMSPVDEFLGFKRLLQNGGRSPADLAKRFGFSERVVKQRLRLAELVPEVLNALSERQITLDAAMAYATSQDPVLQLEVFENQAKRGRTAHDPAGIRHSLRMKGLDTADPLFRFVGPDIYARDGGTYEDDLFNEPGKDRVLAQPFVLETAAKTMLDFQAIRLIEELKADDAWAPTIVGYVEVPTLRLHSYGTTEKLRPPVGFVMVERADHPKLWRTIRNNGFNVHVVVGIDVAGQLIADPRYAFVPIAQKAAIDRPALVDVAADRERDAAAYREREIIRWSRRLAVGPFAGTPFEGRVFWPEASSDRQLASNIAGVDGFMVGMQVFVPADQVPAHRKAAISKVDQMIAARGNA